MKTTRQLITELSKKVEQINLAADREVTRNLQALEMALTTLKLGTNKLNDSTLNSLIVKTRKSVDDIVDHLLSKKII
jgi:hypothetical protein